MRNASMPENGFGRDSATLSPASWCCQGGKVRVWTGSTCRAAEAGCGIRAYGCPEPEAGVWDVNRAGSYPVTVAVARLGQQGDSGPRPFGTASPAHLPAAGPCAPDWDGLGWASGAAGGSGSQDFGKSPKGHQDFQKGALSGGGREGSYPKSFQK